MAAILKIKVSDSPPAWASEASHVYESPLGDQWLAALRDEDLVFGTSDQEEGGWQEFSVPVEELRKPTTWRLYPGSVFTMPSTLARVRFGASELLWVVSVLHTVSEAVKRQDMREPAPKVKE